MGAASYSEWAQRAYSENPKMGTASSLWWAQRSLRAFYQQVTQPPPHGEVTDSPNNCKYLTIHILPDRIFCNLTIKIAYSKPEFTVHHFTELGIFARPTKWIPRREVECNNIKGVPLIVITPGVEMQRQLSSLSRVRVQVTFQWTCKVYGRC